MAGGVIGTGNLPKLNWPGIKAINSMVYAHHPKVYTKYLTTVQSDKAWEEYQGVGGFGLGQVKPQGTSMSYDSQQQGFTTRIVNQTMALGFIVTMEERMDNQYQEVANYRARALAFSMEQAKEQLAAMPFNRAFTSGYIGADGIVLGSTAHTTISGLTYANRPTVDASLSESALEDGLTAVSRFQDERGLYIGVRPRALMVPSALSFQAYRLLHADGQADTFNNNPNAIKSMGLFPDGIIVNIYLTNPGAWFIINELGSGGYGMIFQERMKPDFAEDNDFDTKNYKAGTIERYGIGWDNPRGVYAVNGP